jgi:TATA-binding protein-associated factor
LESFVRIAKEARIKRDGAQAALEELSLTYGSELFSKVPQLKDCMSVSTIKGFTEGFPDSIKLPSSTFGQSIIDEFSILRTLLPTFDSKLVSDMEMMYPHVVRAMLCEYSVIRFAAARCFAGMCKANLISGMKVMVEQILPVVPDQLDLRHRQGAVECIYRIMHLVLSLM